VNEKREGGVKGGEERRRGVENVEIFKT
jgi:hypothetical protein